MKSDHTINATTTATAAELYAEMNRVINDPNSTLQQIWTAKDRYLRAKSEEEKAEARRKAEEKARRWAEFEAKCKAPFFYEGKDLWRYIEPHEFHKRFRGELSFDEFIELACFDFSKRVMFPFVKPAEVAKYLDELIEDEEVSASAIIDALARHYDYGIPDGVYRKLIASGLSRANRRKLEEARSHSVAMTREAFGKRIEEEGHDVEDFIHDAIAFFSICRPGDPLELKIELKWREEYEPYFCSSAEDDEYGGLYWPSPDEIV